MARTPLYSRSSQRPAEPAPGLLPTPPAPGAAAAHAHPTNAAADANPTLRQRLAIRLRRHRRGLTGLLMLALLVIAGWPGWTARVQLPLTMAQIDTALRDSIAKQPLVSAGVAAYEAILPSVVRVQGDAAPGQGRSSGADGSPGGRPGHHADGTPGDDGHSVGSGVVIVDKGLILTSLHVVDGATRLTVTFADGSQSEAFVVSRQPENDLAVLQAKTTPDDLHAATLRSTAGLASGDAVLAVGFPFGIGPSASLGVVSGLKREFRSPEGQRILTNLIQFDAAANPGNSGGPLVTMDGQVVGIVTAILNPSHQRTFIGIGFAVPIENAASAAGLHPF